MNFCWEIFQQTMDHQMVWWSLMDFPTFRFADGFSHQISSVPSCLISRHYMFLITVVYLICIFPRVDFTLHIFGIFISVLIIFCFWMPIIWHPMKFINVFPQVFINFLMFSPCFPDSLQHPTIKTIQNRHEKHVKNMWKTCENPLQLGLPPKPPWFSHEKICIQNPQVGPLWKSSGHRPPGDHATAGE